MCANSASTGLCGGQRVTTVPTATGCLGANAAWLRLAVLTYNVLTVLKRLALPPELLAARPKRLRFLIFHRSGKLVQHARQKLPRLARG